MTTTTQTINTSADFDRWWMETGQFLQPCDAADPETREQFRLFASKMYGFEDTHYQAKFEKAEEQMAEVKDQLSDTEKELETLESDIQQVLDSGDSNVDKLRDIKILLK